MRSYNAAAQTTWEFATEHYDIAFGCSFEYIEGDTTRIATVVPLTRCDSHVRVQVRRRAVVGQRAGGPGLITRRCDAAGRAHEHDVGRLSAQVRQRILAVAVKGAVLQGLLVGLEQRRKRAIASVRVTSVQAVWTARWKRAP